MKSAAHELLPDQELPPSQHWQQMFIKQARKSSVRMFRGRLDLASDGFTGAAARNAIASQNYGNFVLNEALIEWQTGKALSSSS